MLQSYSRAALGVVMSSGAKDPRAVQLGEWLQKWRRKRGLTRPEAVQEMQKHDPRAAISSDYLAKMEYGQRSLASAGKDVREALRRALNIDRQDWERDTGLLIPAELGQGTLDAQDGAVPLIEKNKTLIPVYDMAAAAPGGIGVDAVPVRHVEVNPAYLKPGARAFMVLGDSMDDGTRESIADGDVVLVNMNDCDLRDEKTYIVKVPGNGVLIKRVRLYEDGEMYLVSDNTRYRPIRPDEAQIIGRVYRHIPAEREM